MAQFMWRKLLAITSTVINNWFSWTLITSDGTCFRDARLGKPKFTWYTDNIWKAKWKTAEQVIV